jgi:hypothetical protein
MLGLFARCGKFFFQKDEPAFQFQVPHQRHIIYIYVNYVCLTAILPELEEKRYIIYMNSSC